MADQTGIEWTDATWPDRTVVHFTEKDGTRRARVYQRKTADRPGVQERRAKRAIGLAWCRGCRDWLPVGDVTKQGACRPCVNAEYRAQYAADGRAIRARVHARQRSIDPLPVIGAEHLLEQFEGACAYCPAPATTWDHIRPVRDGGQTVPGNVVPACTTCNSSKKATDVFTWLAATGRTPSPSLFDVLALEAF
jgi:5-methylcytosine-specific restriction endonuclease McrA